MKKFFKNIKVYFVIIIEIISLFIFCILYFFIWGVNHIFKRIIFKRISKKEKDLIPINNL